MSTEMSLELRLRHRAELVAKQQIQTLLGNSHVAAALQRAIEVESRAIHQLQTPCSA